MERIELACHTGYSRARGIGLGGDWVNFAVREGIETLVITDTGNVDGFADFRREIAQKGLKIKLIMGADLYVFDDRAIPETAASEGRLSVLIKNEVGRRNLYRILSEGEKRYKHDGTEPKLPLSLLLENREGLLIGSGSNNSLLISSIAAGLADSNEAADCFAKDWSAQDIYGFLDYVEFPYDSRNAVLTFVLLETAKRCRIPAVATSAPCCMSPDELTACAIISNTYTYECSCYRTTDEMMDAFAFLGREKAYEIVVTNTHLIADMCEEVAVLAEGKLYPYAENQDELLREICEKALPQKYAKVTPEIRERLNWELEAIRNSKSAFMFIQVRDVTERLKLQPFEFGIRGLVGSSVVAYLCGIVETDPIRAKLSPYFFFGYYGDKEPDIDINFRTGIQKEVQKLLADVPGAGGAIKAGTTLTIGAAKAKSIINAYCKEHHIHFPEDELRTIVAMLTHCVYRKLPHPGGMIILPKGAEPADIGPVCRVKYEDEIVEISAFEYYCIDENVYKFDALANPYPEIIKRLYEITGANPLEISTDDAEVLNMFRIKEGETPAFAGIPEFSGSFVFDVLKTADCRSFDDLVKVNGLVHGTGTWIDNAETLLNDGTVAISDLIATREDIFDSLLNYGLCDETAFRIAEEVRRGKVSAGRSSKWGEYKAVMEEHEVPEWFIDSCERIMYLFPRAHCCAYTLGSWRIAWYKLHYPKEFEEVMGEMK